MTRTEKGRIEQATRWYYETEIKTPRDTVEAIARRHNTTIAYVEREIATCKAMLAEFNAFYEQHPEEARRQLEIGLALRRSRASLN